MISRADWDTRLEQLVSRADWDTRLEQLVEYKKANGNCNVPRIFSPNPPLGQWVQEQRRANKDQKLTKECLKKLNSIGFDWKPQYGWIAHNQQLEDENEQAHGQLDAPKRCSGSNPSHLHKLPTEHYFNNRHKEKLDHTESVAEIKTSDNENCWDVHFRELLAYFQIYGDFNVPPCYLHNPLLAGWVSEQRNEYDLKRRGKKTSLTPLREATLDAIGFTWIAGATEEDAPLECVSSASVRPEEAPSGTQVKSENNGVAVPDSITSV
jgi:hypothetical protein